MWSASYSESNAASALYWSPAREEEEGENRCAYLFVKQPSLGFPMFFGTCMSH